MQNRVLTSKSDVYSFGMLLWEIYTFGETPFQEVENFQLKRNLLNGQILERPTHASENVYALNSSLKKSHYFEIFLIFENIFRYEIMQNCWRLNPESRPSFDSLEKWLYQLL